MNSLLGPLLVSLLAAGCATTGDVTAFKDANDTSKLQESEGRLWHEARGYDATIERSGQIYEDRRASAYLQGVMDRLYPEFKGKIHVHLYDSTQLNAFALPNGSIYFNIGLLARIGSEAQLAAVLGHEAAHFIEKHSFRQRVSAKNASAFAVSGIPFASLAAVSSISGYSRDLEREADEYAAWMLTVNRMPVSLLIDALQALEQSHGARSDPGALSYLSSHPATAERIATLRAFGK